VSIASCWTAPRPNSLAAGRGRDLAARGVVDQETGEALARAVAFRNILVWRTSTPSWLTSPG
jgi:hypothetical protein